MVKLTDFKPIKQKTLLIQGARPHKLKHGNALMQSNQLYAIIFLSQYLAHKNSVEYFTDVIYFPALIDLLTLVVYFSLILYNQ